MIETTVLEEIQTQAVPATRADVEKRKIAIYDVPGKFTQRRFVLKSEAEVNAQIELIQSQIARTEADFQRAKTELLPLEALRLKQLQRTQDRSVTRAQRMIESLRQQGQSYSFDETYARIDMSFLAMQNWSTVHQCPVPLFALFTPDNPVCTLEISSYSEELYERFMKSYLSFEPCQSKDYSTSKHFDNYELKGYFDTTGLEELCERVALEKAANFRPSEVHVSGGNSTRSERNLASCNAKLTASTKFAGVIPEAARSLIREAGKTFDAVYIVAEVPEWTISIDVEVLPAPIPTGDPLIIGRKDKAFWLLSRFDTTATEEYAAVNFTKAQ